MNRNKWWNELNDWEKKNEKIRKTYFPFINRILCNNFEKRFKENFFLWIVEYLLQQIHARKRKTIRNVVDTKESHPVSQSVLLQVHDNKSKRKNNLHMRKSIHIAFWLLFLYKYPSLFLLPAIEINKSIFLSLLFLFYEKER